jgi:uncharacterized protein involved in type VI secretion and phage assembly
VCQLYRFEIELASSQEQVAFDDVVGKPAVLSINTEWGTRWFHGIISRFEMTGETTDQTYFRAELVPTVWLLTHRYNSRIFQQKSTKDIVSTVLTDAGIASDRFDLSQLKQEYKPRDYCVQYRETDYNFICRLMEEEGIRWYFSQTQDAHVLVLADMGEYVPMGGEPALPYHPPTDMNVTEEHVFRFRMGQCVRPGAVVLNDFNFEKPQLNLESTHDLGRDLALEFSDYPGEYREQGAGTTIAKLRAEEFESGRIHGVGQSNSPRLAPGLTFDLTEHPSDSANRSYLVTSVTHHGKESTERTTTPSNGRGSVLDARIHQSLLQAQRNESRVIRELAEGLLQIASRLKAGDLSAHRALTQWLYHAGQVAKDLPSTAAASGGSTLEALSIPNLIDDVARSTLVDYDAPVYECRFECIPADVTYRPARVTPWPVMRGCQTARVVGPEGEEIHTDEYGRVKVQFNWDREGGFKENASCWIRVSQGMAGGQYGMMFLPRIGQEVIVDFLEGDPDQPIITGRVYNADHMPPYELPKEKTKSTIKTNSTPEAEGFNEIRFEDKKGDEQVFIHAEKNLDIRVKNDRFETISRNRHLHVEQDKFEHVDNNRSETVDADHMEEIGKDRHVNVKGKEAREVGGSLSVTVGGDVIEVFKAGHSEETTKDYYLTAQNVVIEATQMITLKCGSGSVVVDSAGVTVKGGTVTIDGGMTKINSGPGSPPGTGVAGSAVAPAAPEKAEDADIADPGKMARIKRGQIETKTGKYGSVPGHPFKPDETKTSWIEIKLIDEQGNPVPGKRYEITLPDGKTVAKGTLDNEGWARVEGFDPGECKVTFPDLDKDVWDFFEKKGPRGKE